MRFSKESQLEDLLPLLLLMVILVFLLMFASCSKQVRENKLKEEVDFQSIRVDSTQLLISFLKSPFAYDNHEISTVADAMNYYLLTEDKILLEQINKQTKEFFSTSKLESGNSFWSLHFQYHLVKPVIIESDEATLRYFEKRSISTVILPTNEMHELIEIRMFILYK
ncbi:MAG: hypothetical protein IH934_02810 [Nanoarchaeota archaeon]|nr:hypothetical protein [Nanoarchaeota archaeon]